MTSPAASPGAADAVAVLSDRGQAPALPGREIRCFRDFAAFRAARWQPQAFLVACDDPRQAGAALRAIRRDPQHATALVFVEGRARRIDRALGDGRLPGTADALAERIEAMRARIGDLRSRNHTLGPAAVLLEYLWLRPGRGLEPLSDWRHPRRYRYPLLEVLAPEDADPETTLRRLEQAGLIARQKLLDRQRECDHCGGAQLSFIDLCPACRGIDVASRRALQCPACGLLAPEARFGARCICPNCATPLEGTARERLLEIRECGGCGHLFVEGEVEARCLLCGRSSTPGALREHRIHAWQLTPLGKLAMRKPAVPESPSPASPGVPDSAVAVFLHQLDGALSLARRKGGLGFGLIALRLENLAELRAALGGQPATALLEQFAVRLRGLLAPADSAARLDLEMLALLLPGCDEARLAALQKSIQALVLQWCRGNGVGCRWRAVNLLVPAGGTRDSDAGALMRKLQATLAPRAPAPRRGARLVAYTGTD